MNAPVFRTPSQRRRHTALEMRRRLVAHVAAGGTTDHAEGTLENWPSAYTDPERAVRERLLLFQGQPLLAGLSRDVPDPGDCLVFEEVGPSVLIVRGQDGKLRAFLNMCSHRASRLVQPEEQGKCPRRAWITCPFHGWSFDLEGRLVGMPGSEGFDGIDPSSRGLIPMPVEECHGLIFVQASTMSDHLDIPAFLGRFAPELAQLELDVLVPVRHSLLNANTDWKLALDTYCEGYHFGILHRTTIGKSHFSNVAVFDDFSPHWRIGFAERSLQALVGQPESDWPEPSFTAIYFLFPNTVIVMGELETGDSYLRLFRLFPGERPGTMSCRISVYASPSVARDKDCAGWAFALDDAVSEITLEDYEVAEQAYRNLLHAPEGYKVIYGRNEPALQAFHRAVAQRIGEDM